jgi:hypothetical protein
MRQPVQLPEVPEGEQTPLVKELLEITQGLAQTVWSQAEEIERLKDEVLILKGQKKRPRFKSSKMNEQAGTRGKKKRRRGKRAGSKKRHKTKQLQIHHEEVVAPAEPIPEGSRFKGYRDFVVQELVIEACNTKYRLQRWKTPDGRILMGQLPASVRDRHFGPLLTSYILYQHHHCQVTQPLLLEQLREWKIDISAGQIDALLSREKDEFHDEKDELLRAGLSSSRYVTVDDTGARHRGNNGYVTHIGNEAFAWFEGTSHKSRINFLQLLRAGHTDYQVDEQALAYMHEHKLPIAMVTRLRDAEPCHFADEQQWTQHLQQRGITQQRHQRAATEGALLGSVLEHGVPEDLAIISDDAGQFNVMLHGLCWLHAERLVHKLIPLNETHRKELEQVRGQIWDLYADLRTYKIEPSPPAKLELDARFDSIFSTRTTFETLNQTLKRLGKNKSELLLVLERPDVPLHTNGSEGDIRDYVKKKKVSGGTRSDLGRRCRDTFASLKKTCRKQGISFWLFLFDRVSRTNAIPPLPDLIRKQASASA